MKRELRDQWLKALRSGAYDQGQSALRIQDLEVCKYCCLGVLADVSDAFEWDGDAAVFNVDVDGRENDPLYWVDFDWDVLSYLGLTVDQQGILIDMNDSTEHSFDDIANWIEKNIDVEV